MVLFNHDSKIGLLIAGVIKLVLIFNFIGMDYVSEVVNINKSTTYPWYSGLFWPGFMASFFNVMLLPVSVFGIVILIVLTVKKGESPKNKGLRKFLYFISWYLILNLITVPIITSINFF